MAADLYVPEPARILDVVDETSDVKTFALDLDGNGGGGRFRALPGQFVEVSVAGFGEVPIGIASSYDRDGRFDITVRKVGCVTSELHRAHPGEVIGIRGPLGNFFPYSLAEDREPIFVAGGIGLPPLRSLIHYMLARPKEYPKITILYGARTPADLVYKEEIKRWQADPRIDFHVTVDIGDDAWSGKVGLVTELFNGIHPDYRNAIAFVCGPPIMIHYVILTLLDLGMPQEMIISTLERHMKCGVGKCGHCAVGHKYVCTDGPVFSYTQIKELEWQSGENPT